MRGPRTSDTELNQEVGSRIKKARKDKGISQAELGRRLQYQGNSSPYKLESGRTGVDLPLAIALANELGVSLDYLILGIETTGTDTMLSESQRVDVLDQYHATERERAAFKRHLRMSPNRVNVSYIVGWLLGLRQRGSLTEATDSGIQSLARAERRQITHDAPPAADPEAALRARKPTRKRKARDESA